ncbi:MAG: 4-alpha-glucanotransferase, partial [Clostridia bacterium]|nr:4-alpha-glucanotransferase [Clostridia bacterium]
IIDAIKEVAGDKLVIAEDLGVITDEVRELLEYSGMPGMRVLQFGFTEGNTSPHLPHNFPEKCVAYTGTHDNNTTLGALYELTDEQKRRVADYLCTDPCNVNQLTKASICAVLRSKAELSVIPLQDILGYGKDTRMNIPGNARENWAYRVAPWQLESLDVANIRYMNELFGRISD